MNKKSQIIISFIILLGLFSCKTKSTVSNYENKMAFITGQFENTLCLATNPAKIPRTLQKDGTLECVEIYDWTSGFFAGSLWYLYHLTGEVKWKKEAVKWTEALDSVQYYTGNHDVGFMINCSYGNGLKFANKIHYKDIVVQTAKSLCTRYNPVVKCIESWNERKSWDGVTIWKFPVIIDNMMNLELLFEASSLSKDETYKKIAIQHAETTMKNHYRRDYSCYHVVDYDTTTGNVLHKATCQGFADESSWARGQAWSLYGYVVCYRYTKDKKFLGFAENIANYIIHNKNMPEDLIPYWDYNVKDTGLKPDWNYNSADYPVIPRDASAAAVTCSALYELAAYSEKKGEFLKAADKMLQSLSSPAYMAYGEGNKYFILNHSVGSIPHGVEIDVPLNYADYYFLEALVRSKKFKHR